MLKSSRLVAITGCLLGLSVTLLPLGTHAVTITQDEVNVSATIDGYLSFLAVGHTDHTTDASYTSTYDSGTNTYSGTFNVGDHTDTFGTTRYQVSCNFLADNDFNPNTCHHGWTVSATVTNDNDASKNYDASSHAAIMIPANPSNSYRIQSITANGLTGANSNWLLKVNGVSRTYNGHTTAPAGAQYTDSVNGISRDYNNSFEALPYGNATNKRVATGNTFTPDTVGNVTTYSYNGYQEFDVTYGFSAGHATADTYTGTITYTLAINAS